MQTLPQDALAALIQANQFIGWTCQLDYEKAVVLTCDPWKARAQGVPHNCFLLAARRLAGGRPAGRIPREIILLRVTGSAPTPVDDETLHARIQTSRPGRAHPPSPNPPAPGG